jgi:hypothetical protein
MDSNFNRMIFKSLIGEARDFYTTIGERSPPTNRKRAGRAGTGGGLHSTTMGGKSIGYDEAKHLTFSYRQWRGDEIPGSNYFRELTPVTFEPLKLPLLSNSDWGSPDYIIQGHFPPEIKNGLSFHLIIGCGPVRDRDRKGGLSRHSLKRNAPFPW